uniref:Uncharacterized protein n=1 Tax=Norrisiella sphaerica TaxID=552664 RepID=A0A7S2QS58_9EUKA
MARHSFYQTFSFLGIALSVLAIVVLGLGRSGVPQIAAFPGIGNCRASRFSHPQISMSGIRHRKQIQRIVGGLLPHAILLPSQNSQTAVKNVIAELGITEKAAEKLISKSLDKMDWEMAEDEDQGSPLERTSLAQASLETIEDPYIETKAVINSLRSIGFERDEIKLLVTRFPLILRLQSEGVQGVIDLLSNIGMKDVQVRRYLMQKPALLAYDVSKHIIPALKTLRKRTKLNDKTLATLISMQPDLLTALIDSTWSSARSNMLLKEAYRSQRRSAKLFKKSTKGKDPMDDIQN